MRTFGMRAYGFPLSGYGYGMPLTYGLRNPALPLRSHKRLSYGLLHRPRFMTGYSDDEEEKEIEEETEVDEEEAKVDETEEEERSHYGLTYGLPSYGHGHGRTYGLSSYGYGRPSFRRVYGYGSSTYGFPSYGRYGRTTGYGDEEQEQEVADEEEEKFEDVEPESEERSDVETEESEEERGYGGFRVSKFAKSAPCVNKFNMPVPCAGYGYGKMTYGRFPFHNFY
jgi:uncharacterized Zn finger protein (UPF0148 family)